MLQVMLCAICMMSAALLYYDFVIIPPAEPGTGGGLKSHFPEVFPPGGGSPTQKEEQAGREPEVSAVDLRFLQSQYPDVRGWLTIPESGIDYPVLQRQPGRTGVLSAEGLPGKLRHQWKFVPPGRLYSGRIGESDHLRSQHEQRGNVRESGSVLLL